MGPSEKRIQCKRGMGIGVLQAGAMMRIDGNRWLIRCDLGIINDADKSMDGDKLFGISRAAIK